MLRLRVLSALVGIPLVLGAVYLGGVWYFLFILLAANLGMSEYNRLLRSRGGMPPAWLGHAGVTLLLLVIFHRQLELVFPYIMLIFIVLFLVALLYFERVNFWESALLFWGIIYLGGLFGFMLLLRMLPEGARYTYLLFIGVWLHDSFAYFIGVKWGRRKLAPRISPQKSVQGSVAGILGTMLSVLLATLAVPGLLPFGPGRALLLGLGLSVFAQLGDLMESALKRQFQVKDSGGLIPGHGGVLDRFDSLLVAAPFVYYFVQLL